MASSLGTAVETDNRLVGLAEPGSHALDDLDYFLRPANAAKVHDVELIFFDVSLQLGRQFHNPSHVLARLFGILLQDQESSAAPVRHPVGSLGSESIRRKRVARTLTRERKSEEDNGEEN